MAREQTQVSGPFVEEEGLMGVFTRDQADGAIPNGSVVEKRHTEPGDMTEDGTKGIVVGSINIADHPEHFEELTGTGIKPGPGEKYVYFVQWESAQVMVVSLREHRVEKVDAPLPFNPDEPEELGIEFFEVPMSSMQILPPAPNVCQVCAADHDPAEPHTPNSLFWQTKRNMEGLEPASWEDAIAHCAEPVRESWIVALELKGATIDREKLNRLLAEKEGE